MKLADLLAAYLAAHDCGIRYRESLSRTTKKAVEAGIESVAHLKAEQVNRFLSGLSSLTATTRQNVRRELLTLWRWAFEEGMTQAPPLRVIRIKSRAIAPQAWTIRSMSDMLTKAEQDETVVSQKHNMRVCDWLPCWIVVSYDTGIRFGDALTLHSSNVRNGALVTVASKTGKKLVRPLSQYAQEAVQELLARSPDGTLFKWFLTRRRAFLAIRAFLDRHGIEGSMKYLRRSCATYIEAVRPGEATRYLQHSAPFLTAKHYVDESLLAVPAGPPPIR